MDETTNTSTDATTQADQTYGAIYVESEGTSEVYIID